MVLIGRSTTFNSQVKNPEFCQRARDNLDALDSGVQIQMRDKNGELRAITEDERAIQRRKATDTIAIHCE